VSRAGGAGGGSVAGIYRIRRRMRRAALGGLPLVDLTAQGGRAGGAERELAEAVLARVAFPAAGAYAQDARARLARPGSSDCRRSAVTSSLPVTSQLRGRPTSRLALLVRSPEA
jgi:hypothetical protein